MGVKHISSQILGQAPFLSLAYFTTVSLSLSVWGDGASDKSTEAAASLPPLHTFPRLIWEWGWKENHPLPLFPKKAEFLFF